MHILFIASMCPINNIAYIGIQPWIKRYIHRPNVKQLWTSTNIYIFTPQSPLIWNIKKKGTIQHLFVYSKTRLSLASVSLLSSAIWSLASRSLWFFCLWLYFWSFSLRRAERTKLGWTNSGFSNTVGPPNEPSKIRIGVRQKRGPISTNEISSLSKGSKPGVFVAFFSTIYNSPHQYLDPHPRSKKLTW